MLVTLKGFSSPASLELWFEAVHYWLPVVKLQDVEYALVPPLLIALMCQ
jgi:hypothetical protein